ncbi:hypothetical protein K449DRAFT_451670 [Hypoxylon sp. EC38]|nr:hypothetical protein K449DRAFT_451670 [Hypoxylon sp. EC38]
MQFTLLLAPLAFLLQTSTALPADTVYEIQELPTIPLNETLYWAELQAGEGTVSKRDSCGSGYPYNQADMNRLIQSLQSDGQTDYMPAGSGKGWLLGTAVVCTYNNYIFENTHVSHAEMAWGASYIKGQCCPSENSNPQCSGGSCTGHGDSGLSVIISTHNSATHC